MSEELKGILHDYLRGARETLVWKLEGLGEYDIRRPLTPTGTNLLGLVKHSASSHVRYFGEVFALADAPSLVWQRTGGDPNSDLWARADESRNEIVALALRAWAFGDLAIADLRLDAVGHVPWWGGSAVTLHHVLVHVIADTQRHAGHADILRELLDGSVGLLDGHGNLPSLDATGWSAHHDRVESAARKASQR